MLFSSLFKNDKRISVGRGRRRKLTIKEVVSHLDQIELTTANCTLIRDHLGNDKLEDYGQVDIYRVRDERLFVVDNGIFITTPTGMKLKSDLGDSELSGIVSEADSHHEIVDGLNAQGFEEEEHEEEEEAIDEDDPDRQGDPPPKRAKGSTGNDAYSDGDGRSRRNARREPEPADQALGVGQIIRLRFFSRRIPYEIDCQILDRFNPTRYRDVELTPRWGVGYRVRPPTDVRKRDQRSYVRYTHRIGFGHLRVRNEIQFNVYAKRTSLEIPEKGALKQTLTREDFEVFPFGDAEVEETRAAERLEDIVEFFMASMVANPTDRRFVYASKPYLDRLNRSSLEGLGYFNVVGAQQTTVLPKIFVKRQAKGESVLEKQMAGKSQATRDARKLRAIEEMQERYQMLTREQKIWQKRRMGKSVLGDFQDDIVHLGFTTSHGLSADGHTTARQLMMPAEVSDIGVENITLKPMPYDDARSREREGREYVRQEDGFQIDLLNFSVGGAQIRGGEAHEVNEGFLKYLVGEDYDSMSFAERIEALQKHAILLNFYPSLHFNRTQIADYKPYLPFRIPVIARVARFRTARVKETDDLQIASIGIEFIYNPIQDSFSRDINEYDQWEQVTPYTESQHFIEVHKSLQLLFGFDRAMDESLREDGRRSREEKESEGEESPDEGAVEEETTE